ncbi:MAG: nucleoside deaminase [Gammaproteobacteria bacterium]
MVLDINRFMQEAIKLATLQNTLWPFSAILVNDIDEIVATAVNNAQISPILHAEVNVIHQYALRHSQPDLSHLTLFTTAEPCPMCQSAIYWAKIRTVYFGSSIPFLNNLWGRQITMRADEIIDKTPSWYKSSTKLYGKILEDECNQLFLHAKKLQSDLIVIKE